VDHPAGPDQTVIVTEFLPLSGGLSVWITGPGWVGR
jgi:hypothetical protein